MLWLRTGATRVFIFDHTIRREKKADEPEAALRGPVRNVHIDQSYAASVERVRYHLPDEAEQLLQKRFQIINVCDFQASSHLPFLFTFHLENDTHIHSHIHMYILVCT